MADQRAARTARLPVKVIAGASRSEIADWSAGRLRVRVSAVAERGKANAALIRLLAERLGLPGSALRVVAGKTSVRKTLEIAGLGEAELRERLGG
jgi:uncharacterized protein YggU (UPF0235/DUF167 family)